MDARWLRAERGFEAKAIACQAPLGTQAGTVQRGNATGAWTWAAGVTRPIRRSLAGDHSFFTASCADGRSRAEWGRAMACPRSAGAAWAPPQVGAWAASGPDRASASVRLRR